MFKTNLKIAWRNLIKDKQFTFINVFGLSAGLASALLILLWVNDELKYDKIFANNENIYQLIQDNSEATSGILAEKIEAQMSDIQHIAAVAPTAWFPEFTLTTGDKNIKASGQFAGQDYFKIFQFKLLEGDRNTLLNDITSIVLSEGLAKKIFGTTENIIGKPIFFDQDTTLYVSGIFETLPRQSSQQFEFVVPYKYFQITRPWSATGDRGPRTYATLKSGTDVPTFNQKATDVVTRMAGDTVQIAAVKFSSLYLHNIYDGADEGRIKYVRLFTILALIILVIACINFMNLSTAKASRRLKEIGIKKVVGARRDHLIWQFLSESLLLTFFAALLAIGIAIALLPTFNEITGKQIDLTTDPKILIYFIPVLLCTGLLAGSYPALYLSRFNPLSVLKGKITSSVAEVLSRKGLVVFQFSLSTVLIVSVMIIYLQMQFIQETDLGYNKNNIIRIPVEGNIKGKEESFIAGIMKIPGVKHASTSHHKLVGRGYSHYGMEWPGKDENNDILFEAFEVNYGFVETMGMTLKEGRTFSRDFGGDSASIIINESAAKAMGLENPVGSIIKKSGRPLTIIGVVKDFHFESMHEAIRPAYMFRYPGGTIIASLHPENQRKTIADIEALYSKFNPGFPFTFNFLDAAYQQQYDSELRVSALSKYFAALAILISCLGLFGLSAFMAQKRKKEIGVRKVVGASVANITAMLSKDFLRLVLLSFLIAVPVSWWVMNRWLENFTYRIDITPVVFLGAGAILLIITLVTISFQSIKAATANPVKSLRWE